MSPATLQAQADALDAKAREHKRASRYHRDQAQRARQQLDQIVEFARAHGIQIKVAAPTEARTNGNPNT